MLRHWLSVFLLLLPVMTFGWLIASVFIWKLIPSLKWVEALVMAACVTATDPVLASAVVGKGKFARRVPGHLRNLLSAESGCNDGMAFPFAYLGLLCIKHAGETNVIAFRFIVITCLYECVFGTVLGAIIGYCGRHLIKYAEKKNLIDRESFLVFYFVLALFCGGVGSIIGTDDLLVAFSAGAAFSWDGWFAKKTEETHVSNVIDLLLNMAFFVYFGAIVPWNQFNEASLGLHPGKLVVIAILIILFRRIPIMLALKPIIPDIRTWREALFCGHFGPIGVGAIFISILARAELEHEGPTPLATLPSPSHPNYIVVATIWPVTCFLIIASIVVHGSSIAVFTLGKHLNNLTMTLTYTTNGDHSQRWLNRIPRIESRRNSMAISKGDISNPISEVSTTELNGDGELYNLPVTSKQVKPHGGMKRRRFQGGSVGELRVPEKIAIDLNAGRRQKLRAEEEEISTEGDYYDDYDESYDEKEIDPSDRELDYRSAPMPMLRLKSVEKQDDTKGLQAYQEGSRLILEDDEGEIIDEIETNGSYIDEKGTIISPHRRGSGQSNNSFHDLEIQENPYKENVMERLPSVNGNGSKKVRAYRVNQDVLIENMEGEIIRRYRIASEETSAPANESRPNVPTSHRQSLISTSMTKTLSLVGLRRHSEQNLPLDMNSSKIELGNAELIRMPERTLRPESEHFHDDDERVVQRLRKLLDDKTVNASKLSERTHSNSSKSPSHSPVEKKSRLPPTNRSFSMQKKFPRLVRPGSFRRNSDSPQTNSKPFAPIDENSDNTKYKKKKDENQNSQFYFDGLEENEIERERRLAAFASTTDDMDDEEFLASRSKRAEIARRQSIQSNHN